MSKETYEIRTGEKGLSILTTENNPMDAVSHAVDIGLVSEGDSGSVAPVRELPDTGTPRVSND